MITPVDIIFGKAVEKKILEGVTLLSKTVGTTLGPRGKNVVIQTQGKAKSTKDGVTVAQHVNVRDPALKAVVDMVKEAASKTAIVAGDGTTTATILTEALVKEGLKLMKKEGLGPVVVAQGMERAFKLIEKKLHKASKKCTTHRAISDVATISANGDKEIGDLIATVVREVGKDGVVSVEESTDSTDSYEVVKGMKFDQGLLSPHFAAESTKGSTVMEDPFILLFNDAIRNIHEFLPILEKVAKTQKPLLFIANSVEGEALSTLVINNMRGVIKCAAVTAPGNSEHIKEYLLDIAALTGATILGDESSPALDKIGIEHLGKAGKVIADMTDTVIIKGAGKLQAIADRVTTLEERKKNEKNEFLRQLLVHRLAKLQGGIALIRVGAATELALSEKRDRVDDAVHAVLAATKDGIVPGGGMALLNIAYDNEMMDLATDQSTEDRFGARLVLQSLAVPYETILRNGGADAGIILDLIEISPEGKVDVQGHRGYNLRENKVGDMFKMGVTDPVMVTITALKSAISVASVLLSTECLIVNEPEKDDG